MHFYYNESIRKRLKHLSEKSFFLTYMNIFECSVYLTPDQEPIISPLTISLSVRKSPTIVPPTLDPFYVTCDQAPFSFTTISGGRDGC